MAKQAVLIIIGSFHTPWHYEKIIKRLEKQGLRVICPQIPSNTNDNPQAVHLADDVKLIRDIVAAEVEAGTHLTVVAHSHGGLIACAALGDFALQPSEVGTTQSKGGVVDLIFLCAFLFDKGQSVSGAFGGELPPALIKRPDGIIVWDDPIKRFFHDLPPEEAKELNDRLILASPNMPYDTIDCEIVAWKAIPVTYLVCEDDQALPPFIQDMFIANIRTSGHEVKEVRVVSSHDPFLSVTDKVEELVTEVMKARESG